MFSSPKFQFRGKLHKPDECNGVIAPNLLRSGDLVTDRVTIWGTNYRVGCLVITNVVFKDIVEVGEIENIILRKNKVLFLVSLHDCARDSFNIFRSVPKNCVTVVTYSDLADFKPLTKRGAGTSFSFLLHHYVPRKNFTA
jgi:hypothetical protein